MFSSLLLLVFHFWFLCHCSSLLPAPHLGHLFFGLHSTSSLSWQPFPSFPPLNQFFNPCGQRYWFILMFFFSIVNSKSVTSNIDSSLIYIVSHDSGSVSLFSNMIFSIECSKTSYRSHGKWFLIWILILLMSITKSKHYRIIQAHERPLELMEPMNSCTAKKKKLPLQPTQ